MEKQACDFLAEIAAAVVLADGRLNGKERRALVRLDSLGLGSVSGLVCQEVARCNPGAGDVRVPCAWLRDRGPAVACRIVAALAELAACDGELTPEEIRTVQSVAGLLGLRAVDARILLNAAIVSHGRVAADLHALPVGLAS